MGRRIDSETYQWRGLRAVHVAAGPESDPAPPGEAGGAAADLTATYLRLIAALRSTRENPEDEGAADAIWDRIMGLARALIETRICSADMVETKLSVALLLLDRSSDPLACALTESALADLSRSGAAAAE